MSGLLSPPGAAVCIFPVSREEKRREREERGKERKGKERRSVWDMVEFRIRLHFLAYLVQFGDGAHAVLGTLHEHHWHGGVEE